MSKLPKISSFTELFDEHNEIAAWLILFSMVGLLLSGKIDQWPFLVGIGIGLVTLLGARYFAGIKISKEGLEVKDKCGEDDE
jgi:hypothetical protein